MVLPDFSAEGKGEMEDRWETLTREVRHGLELLLPELGDLDRLCLAGLAVDGHALLVGVGEHLLQVVRVERVEHVEEVLPRRPLVLGVLVGEVAGQQVVLGELGPEAPDGQLIVVRDLDVADVFLPDQLLFVRQHLLEEVLVDRGRRREVELD